MTRFLASLLLIFALSPTDALAVMPERVDDSRTQVMGALRLKWDSAMPKSGAPDTASDRIAVLVHLDVSPWTGRKGRIYLTLDPATGGRTEASWTSRGVLLPGRLRTGDRQLVYAGPIQGDSLQDTLEMTIRTHGGLDAGSRLNFAFEIEVDA